MPPSNKNYYAVESPDKLSLVTQVVDTVTSVCRLAEVDVNAYALIDMAFDHGASHFRTRQLTERLYAEDRWKQLAEVSPTLIQLSVGDQVALHQQVERLVFHCARRPMLSFLLSPMTIVELAQTWRLCIAAEVPGTEPMLLRFADTRVAEVLPKCLTPANWSFLCRPLEQWWIIDRAGSLLQLPRPSCAPETEHPANHNFALSDDELERLVHASLPDALIQTMCDQLPEMVPDQDRLGYHALMKKVVDLAEEHSIDSYPDTYALAVFSVVAGEEALSEASTIDLLKAKAWSSGQLAKKLTEIML